jgi:hypothetical protein
MINRFISYIQDSEAEYIVGAFMGAFGALAAVVLAQYLFGA